MHEQAGMRLLNYYLIKLKIVISSFIIFQCQPHGYCSQLTTVQSISHHKNSSRPRNSGLSDLIKAE